MPNQIESGQQEGWPGAAGNLLTNVMPRSASESRVARTIPDLSFARKYTASHAQRYYEKHQAGLGRRFSNWREVATARYALKLAGHPKSVLDIPCGTGRFWPLLAEKKDRVIYAADLNEPMLETARRLRPPQLVGRVQTFQASAFEVPRPDNFVESVFCMRLLHHMQHGEHRLRLLKELARVASATVIISLWVDGNYKAWRWHVKNRRKGHRNRFLVPRRVVETEFAESGLRIAARVDFLRFYSMWTTYVLRKA
jgi:ubiquinone/menaquinone biosynthesis C-methylase UbiE